MIDVEQEIWKPVVGYEGHYCVSSLGRVRREYSIGNTFVGKIKKPSVNADGYLTMNLSAHGKQKRLAVHRLVADAFLGPRPSDKEINHKNGVKSDNYPGNLEYITHLENVRHAIAAGLTTPSRGERNGQAKMDAPKVRWIRRIWRHGEQTQQDLAKCFGLG